MLRTDGDERYDETQKPENGDERAVKSPDGKWLAFVVNNSLAVRAVETDGATHPETDSQLKDKNEPVVLSMEGSAEITTRYQPSPGRPIRNISPCIASARATGA